MSETFKQSVTFTLDKEHLQECFEQSAAPMQTKDYAKAVIFGVLAVGLIFVEAEHYYIPFFLFCLAILELFSIQYRQTWWVWRQLMGKSANDQVKLIFDDAGITTESTHVNSQILWKDINAIEQTEKGFLLRLKAGTNYISKNYLNEEIVKFVFEKKLLIENEILE